jgi:hypothetical protein
MIYLKTFCLFEEKCTKEFRNDFALSFQLISCLMCKAVFFTRSFLVCVRYWTLKIYYCLISFTHSVLFVFNILFLILNFFSHCFSIVSRPRLYLTSHGQCSGLRSLVTCIGCWLGVVKWQSTCWIDLLFEEEKHTEWAVTVLELIVVIIIVTISIMASSSWTSESHLLHAESGALGSQTATLAELLDRQLCTPFSLCSGFSNERSSRNSTYIPFCSRRLCFLWCSHQTVDSPVV